MLRRHSVIASTTLHSLIQETSSFFQDKMNVNEFMNIPVAILIFDNEGQISYRAYSPHEYHFNADGSNPDHRSEQFGQFLANVYNRVSYDQLQPMNNATN